MKKLLLLVVSLVMTGFLLYSQDYLLLYKQNQQNPKAIPINEIKTKLDLNNLNTICDRAENLKNIKFNYITSRAVASLEKLIPYAIPSLKKDGYFIAYKSIKVQEEIKEAQKILEKYSAEVVDIIEYDLPLRENHTRNLVIIRLL